VGMVGRRDGGTARGVGGHSASTAALRQRGGVKWYCGDEGHASLHIFMREGVLGVVAVAAWRRRLPSSGAATALSLGMPQNMGIGGRRAGVGGERRH